MFPFYLYWDILWINIKVIKLNQNELYLEWNIYNLKIANTLLKLNFSVLLLSKPSKTSNGQSHFIAILTQPKKN